jgi:hypothetical protein
MIFDIFIIYNLNDMRKPIYFLLLVILPLILISCNDPNDDYLGVSPVKGCMNPLSVNYNNKATLDDGSCVMVTTTQNSLTAKFTATWCGPCGSFGATNFENYSINTVGKSLNFSLQVSDDISSQYPTITPLTDAFISHFNIPSLSTPSYGMNNNFLPNQNLTLATTNVLDNYATQPKVGVGLRWTHGDGKNKGKINVNVYVKFYEPSVNDFRLSLFFIAKKIVASQSVDNQTVPLFQHKNVLISEATSNNIYGTYIAFGPIAKDSVIHFPIVLTPPYNMDMSNLRLNAVIWRVVNNKPNFENTTIL